VDLHNDATSLVIEIGYGSFHMPSFDVIGLDDVLYILGLMKSLLLVSCMRDLQYITKLDGR
jgi:hypothetical protein